MATETMTIWYEVTDKKYVEALRKAADDLEKSGYAKLYLSNVAINDDPRGNDPADEMRGRTASLPVIGGGASLNPVPTVAASSSNGGNGKMPLGVGGSGASVNLSYGAGVFGHGSSRGTGNGIAGVGIYHMTLPEFD